MWTATITAVTPNKKEKGASVAVVFSNGAVEDDILDEIVIAGATWEADLKEILLRRLAELAAADRINLEAVQLIGQTFSLEAGKITRS
jgi:hypothetical protein